MDNAPLPHLLPIHRLTSVRASGRPRCCQGRHPSPIPHSTCWSTNHGKLSPFADRRVLTRARQRRELAWARPKVHAGGCRTSRPHLRDCLSHGYPNSGQVPHKVYAVTVFNACQDDYHLAQEIDITSSFACTGRHSRVERPEQTARYFWDDRPRLTVPIRQDTLTPIGSVSPQQPPGTTHHVMDGRLAIK